MTSSYGEAEIGPFVRIAKLAEGGTSILWLARRADRPAEDVFVLKELAPHLRTTPAAVDAIRAEGRLGGMFQSPHLVSCATAFGHGGTMWLPMSLIRGATLRELSVASLREGTLPPLSVIVTLIAQVARGLASAHQQRGEDGGNLHIIHRDVSPSNIVIGFDGVARLIDFGVAFSRLHANLHEDGQLRGKFSYMTPEQVLGLPVEQASDIFSLGITLWEQLLGRPLFRAGSPIETTQRIAHAEIFAPSRLRASIPPALDAITLRCLDRDPKARPTAQELADTLEGILRTLPPQDRAWSLRAFVHHYGHARAQWFQGQGVILGTPARPLAALLAPPTDAGNNRTLASAPIEIATRARLGQSMTSDHEVITSTPTIGAHHYAPNTGDLVAVITNPRELRIRTRP